MARRGENIHKRKDGRWEARYEKGRKENGQIIYGFLYGKTYHEAKNKKLKALRQPSCFVKNQTAPFVDISELSKKWLESVRFILKDSTYMCYTTLIQAHVIPYFDENPKKIFSKNILQDFYRDKIAEGLSHGTIKMLLMLLKRILEYGEDQDLFPSVKRTSVRSKAIPFEKNMLNPEELSKLQQYLQQENTPFSIGILLCIYTGIRVGELCGIKGADIDLQNGILTIRRTISRIRNPNGSIYDSKTILMISTPKSISSIRQIPLSDYILLLLKQYPISDDHYFLTGADKPTEPRNVQRRFKHILEICSLPQVTVHSLRHSFATICIEKGIDSKALSEILGHSSVKITLDIYVHSNMEQKKEYMNRLSI